MLVTLYLNMSVYLSDVGDFTKTRQYLEEARVIAIQNENDEQLSAVYQSMANMYDKLNNVDSAYVYISKYNQLRDNLLNKSKTIDSYQAYVSTFLESAKKELTIAEQEIALKNRWMIITLISSITLILVAVFVLIIIQQKKRRLALIKENERREMEEHLLHVEKIQKINEEKHQEILETKIRELTSYSLLLSGKNKVFQQLLQLSQQLQQAKKEEEKAIEKNMEQLIVNNLNMDNERSSFMFHFNEVHPNFFDKLKHLCNDLTENNLRMCAYFRINMSTKQVALILNVSNETIRNARYRLKKKLGLEEEEDLDSFLRNL
jgi:tetratricopeptide (TPR) repeat protein